MPVFVTDCPHCSAQKMSFESIADYVTSGELCMVFAKCLGCFKPICLQLSSSSSSFLARPLKKIEGNILSMQGFWVHKIWPNVEDIDVPTAIPDRVSRNFTEAATSRRHQLWNAACASYRRCMEIALKQFAPDVEAWKLEKRIDKLAAENRITPDIQRWAHELRLDGNEALHGDEDATEEMVDQMHHLTYFLLIYLYTLPNQIEVVRARRETEERAEE